jgi:uncharacterized membrane protein
MEKVQVKFGEWIEKGFNLYKENIGALILVSLLAVIISSVTFFILLGPMLAGLTLIILELFDKKEPKPDVGRLFDGFNYFLNSFLFILVWGVIIFMASFILSFLPVVGQLASIFLAYAAQALLMFGIFLVVDKKMDFWPASMESINKVKTNFWPFLGLSVVVSIIGGIGVIVCIVGIAVTFPIQYCILTVAYRDVFGGAETPASFAEGSIGSGTTQ